MTSAIKLMCLKNRLKKLMSNPVENVNLINKTKRQIRKYGELA